MYTFFLFSIDRPSPIPLLSYPLPSFLLGSPGVCVLHTPVVVEVGYDRLIHTIPVVLLWFDHRVEVKRV